MDRFVCVHGHFYQPPRENPWLEEVEIQDSARPYHDWNERITAECYRPNAWSRVLDPEGFIVGIVNNYSRISFNVGPTLLRWLERHAPDVYGAILLADRESRERFGGHGSAIAQSFNHSILPLANRRDKETQIAWGLRDFVTRFGRESEGIWLPETAVDLETLELVASAGVKFTILSPFQAARFRKKGAPEWTDVGPEGIPSTRVYEIALPNDQRMALFFYNGGLSSDIAFRGLLNDGRAFAERLGTAFDPGLAEEVQLAHVATDGETYGHHHRHGDMALAMALRELEQRSDVRLTNYAEYLETNAPAYEVELKTPSAWSCAHGVERWRSNCGCNSQMHPGWNQEWRTPLREGLDKLRDRLRSASDPELPKFFADPQATRFRYVDVIGDRSEPSVKEFLTREAGRELTGEETTLALRLLEIERQIQQMYTSCGWFFDDISGIETVQVIQYASRAIQLAQETVGGDFESDFVADLARAQSNVREVGKGDQIYERFVRPARLTLRNVCAHYALSSLFEEYPEQARVFAYSVLSRVRGAAAAGAARLAVGQADVRSEITYESARFTYGALFLAGQSLLGGVRPFQGDEPFHRTSQELLEAFESGDLPRTIRGVDQNFSEGVYSLQLLFRDEQQKIVELLFESLRDGIESSFKRIYESTAPILSNLGTSQTRVPAALRAAAQFYLNDRIRAALERHPPDVDEVRVRLRELKRTNLDVDAASVSYAWTRALESLMDAVSHHPDDGTALKPLQDLVGIAREHSIDVDLSRVQNLYYELVHGEHPTPAPSPGAGEPANGDLKALGEQLRIRAA
jgi:alpha-amylase/alpha-mannosidase (GH57 family)